MLLCVRSDGRREQEKSRISSQMHKSVLDNSIDTLLRSRPVSLSRERVEPS